MTSALLTQFQPAPFAPALDRRLAGAAAVVLVHAALIAIYLATRQAPLEQPDAARVNIKWIALPAPALPAPTIVRRAPSPGPRPAPVPVPPAVAIVSTPPALVSEPAPSAPADALRPPRAAAIREQALRSAGSIDRALRKENRPYIVAPLDSPQIRMRAGMEQAHAMVPPRLWEAPRIEELVNQTGNGERRTRVVGALGTYCITELAPTASIDKVEQEGKTRVTTCPPHEAPATQQNWRTARD
jgi:hypothetical protein